MITSYVNDVCFGTNINHEMLLWFNFNRSMALFLVESFSI